MGSGESALNHERALKVYNERFSYRGRGLASLEKRVGGVDRKIERILLRKKRASILEIGCGFGSVLLEIARKYGDRVALHGVNRRRRDGTSELLVLNARKAGIPEEHAEGITIRFADAGERLPFKDRKFDLVVSQASWLFIPDKLNALREVSRVLRPGGVGRIQFMSNPRQNDAFGKDLIEIRDGGVAIDAVEFLGRSTGMTVEKHGRHRVAIVKKSLAFPAPLRLAEVVRLREHGDDFVGVQSIYEIEPEAVADPA